jgi:hypothetical protein
LTLLVLASHVDSTPEKYANPASINSNRTLCHGQKALTSSRATSRNTGFSRGILLEIEREFRKTFDEVYREHPDRLILLPSVLPLLSRVIVRLARFYGIAVDSGTTDIDLVYHLFTEFLAAWNYRMKRIVDGIPHAFEAKLSNTDRVSNDTDLNDIDFKAIHALDLQTGTPLLAGEPGLTGKRRRVQ